MNSLLDKNSQLVSKSEVEIFNLPPTQIAIERSYWTEVFLKHGLTDSGPFEFHIPAEPSYIDLAKNYVFMELAITTDGAKADPAVVGPINLLGKTLFRQIKVYLNNKVCIDTGDSYAFSSYIETELNYGNEAKGTHLETCLYQRDACNSMNSFDNDGLIYRASLFGKGNVQVMAPLNIDLCNQDRLMLSHMDIRIELHRNNDAFCLMSFDGDTKHKIQVKKMSLFVKKVDLAPSLAMSFETYLSKEPAKYPIRRMVCKNLNIDRGSRDTPHLVVSSGQLPRRLIITFLQKSAFFGDYGKNPFNFEPFDVREITVTAGGYTFPRTPFIMNWKSRCFVQGYIQLLEAMNIALNDRGNSITLNDFANGFFFYAVDLTPDGSDGTHWDLVQEGTCSVRVIFNADLAKDIKMLCFCEYDNVVTIDKHRNVFLDYTT